MSFKIYHDKSWSLQWFDTVDQAIKSMLDNPTHYYHREN
jgi:hypothetical protein